MISWGQPGLDPAADLARLDSELKAGECATTLVMAQGRGPQLFVTSRRDGQTVDIHCDRNSFLWPSEHQIAPVGDPAAAARAVTFVLNLPGASR